MLEIKGRQLLSTPTPGEEMYYDLLDPQRFSLHQERLDALRLAEIGVRTQDEITQQIALIRWNATYPDQPHEQYTSAQLLVSVESNEED